MKKLVLLIALIGCWGVASAQWVVNGTALENTTSGAVNIGSNNGTAGANIQIGNNRSGNGNALFDLVGDVSTYPDFGVRLIRYGKGALAGVSRFSHRGPQALEFKASDNGPIAFLRSGDAVSLYVTSAGKVGIGTDNPGSFDLAVDGSMAARECVITTEDPFPDYVFSSDYNLMPISDLKQFISLNRHLPNIPSAKEVEEEGGFRLGELNLKLLEKIEELTLYILEQEERIKALEARVDQK